MIFLDISKAFDSLNHKILLKSLLLKDSEVSCMTSLIFFLSKPSGYRFVSINRLKSSLAVLALDMPQRSVRRPLLFLLHTNNLPLISKIGKFIFFCQRYKTAATRKILHFTHS